MSKKSGDFFTEDEIQNLPKEHKLIVKSFMEVHKNMNKAVDSANNENLFSSESVDDQLKYSFITATILNILVNNELCVDCFLHGFQEAANLSIEEGYLNHHQEKTKEEHPDLESFVPTGTAH